MKKSVIVAVSLGAILLVGCGSKQDASEKNFKAAIQTFLDSEYPKCYYFESFPAVVDMDFRNRKSTLTAMVKAGLVSVKDEPYEEQEIWGNKKKTSIRPTFYLTEEGKKFYKPDVDKTIGGKSLGGFCFGKAKVRDVPQFTEPSDMRGHNMSRVNYTFVVNDLPSWTKLPEILTAIPALKPDVESENSPIQGKATVVLTNNGWVHERIFNK